MTKNIPSLEMKNVTFGYRNSGLTLAGMSLDVGEGERIAILGESGIGKSSLLRIIAGLERITSGQIFIHGRLVSAENVHCSAEERKVGMVFQDWAVFPHLSVFENIAFGLRSRGKQNQERERVKQLLEEFELEGLASRSPDTLSGGQLQRVACARALAPRPEILLLDEAFSSLDVGLRKRIREQVIKALKIERAASVLVTHDPAEALEFADRVFHMRDGILLDAKMHNEFRQ